ncbi:MAG: hypothetical protein PHV34_19330 [Verrucomicrobiae bacterium]|nr:hypothetical protein [Verrucomicrobiae bacterium]
MKLLPSLLLAVFLTGSLLQAADDKPLSAIETLNKARKLVGDRLANSLLSMESEGAKLRPRYWWVRYFDDQVFLKIRSIQMIGPEMVQNIIPGNFFDGGDKHYIIRPEELKVDSEKCIAFIEKASAEGGIPLHSINVRLCKPHPGESNPVWYFQWYDENNKKLGKMEVSATTGNILEIDGLKLKGKKYKGVSHETFSQKVGGFFSGDEEEKGAKKKSNEKKDEEKSTDQ